jgi:hypothetical protein
MKVKPVSGQANESPDNQHYVTQFILRQFGSGKKRQVFAYDKHTGNVFRSSPRNIASETGFYDVPAGTNSDLIESEQGVTSREQQLVRRGICWRSLPR